MPLAWADVEAMRRKRAPETTAEMRRWTIANVPTLVANDGDPWQRDWAPNALDEALARARAFETAYRGKIDKLQAKDADLLVKAELTTVRYHWKPKNSPRVLSATRFLLWTTPWRSRPKGRIR